MRRLETVGTWLFALLWAMPLLWMTWAAFHDGLATFRGELLASWTLENFSAAFSVAPFGKYYVNTIILVIFTLSCQAVVATLAAYVFARTTFRGSRVLFYFVLAQLTIAPEVLMVENYRTLNRLGLVDTVVGIGLPYIGSAFAIFLLRQAFRGIPRELDEAAAVEGCSFLGTLWHIYVPLARPIYVAFALVSISYHWNNFLWPLIVTSSIESRPLTVGLAIFAKSNETGAQWGIVSAATLIIVAPLLIGFLIFQRQFIQSFVHTGIK
jgi:sn-glycerol 3-phosphate transport system permease protein